MLRSTRYEKKQHCMSFYLLNFLSVFAEKGLVIKFPFLICVCFVCISDKEWVYNLRNISSFSPSKRLSVTISCDVTITAHGFFMLGKEKWSCVTYTRRDYSGPRFLWEKKSQLDKISERFSNSMRFFSLARTKSVRFFFFFFFFFFLYRPDFVSELYV